MTSPSAVLMKQLKAEGWTAGVVEHWNSFAHVRQDLFGFIDIIACHPGSKRIVGFQVTSYANMSARLQKIRDSPHLTSCLRSGLEVIVAGVKPKARNKPQEIKFVPVVLEEWRMNT